MSRWLCLAVMSAGLMALLSGRPTRSADAKDPVRVLFVVDGHGGEQKAPILEKLLADVPGFKVTRLKKLDDLADVKRADHDVMLFYGGPNAKEVQERAIEKFVDDGGGVVALHHASANSSKAWTNLIGCRFTGHPAISNTEVLITDGKHPITAGVEEKFTIFDESYRHAMADVKKNVLAKLKDRLGDKKPDPNTDILWVREVGKGRVVYNALGHGKEAWENPNWQKLVLQSVLWAAGKPAEVKLPAK